MAKFEDINLLEVGNTIQLVGAVWASGSKMYLCMFPEERGHIYERDGDLVFDNGSHVETLNMSFEEWEQFLHQADLLETEILTAGSDGQLVKAIARKSARQISQDISWAVYHRDGFKCRYCGQGPGIPLTVDHLVLWEEQGPSIKSNLLSSCKKCNKTRGNTQYADWLQHSYYLKVSKNLTSTTRQDNLDLVKTLDGIPRMKHKPSKRK